MWNADEQKTDVARYAISPDGVAIPIVGGGTEGDGGGDSGSGDNSGSGASQNDAGKGAGNSADGGLTFSTAQQAKLNELIDGAYTKAYDKAKEEFSKKQDDTQTVKDLRTQLEEAQAKSKTKEQGTLDLDAMKKANEEKDAEIGRLKVGEEANKVLRKKELLLTAVSKFRIRDSADVLALTHGQITLGEDGTTLQVLGAGGAPKVNSAGEPMTIDEFYKDWFNDRPHFLLADGSPGSGSQDSAFGPGSDRAKPLTPDVVRDMPIADLKSRIASEGLVFMGANGQKFEFKSNKNPFAEAKRALAAATRAAGA